MLSRSTLAAASASLLLALAGAGCGSTGVPTAGDATEGEELFTQKCGSCHTLADAGTMGQIGPNLDAAFDRSRNDDGFEQSTIASVVRNMIEYPVPPMPARDELDITDEQADSIAIYVSQVAAVRDAEGNLAAPPPPATGGGGSGSDPVGKEIFASAGCGSCHALADAGASGTVGPSLDDSDVSVPDAQAKIAQGGGGMPAFEGQLTDEQIQEVAQYVVAARGG